jgi:4-amino-4-deoxy-L-arabinose transferase-like glycosyltransferase
VPGLIITAGGILTFLYLSITHGPGNDPAGRRILSQRGALLALAAFLSIAATALQVDFDRRGAENFAPVTILWFGCALALAGAFLDGLPGRQAWRAWARDHRRELFAVAALTLAAAAVRFYALGDIPRVINGDEGLIGQAALLSRKPAWDSPFSLFENIGSLYLQGTALAMAVFGPTPFALRLLPAGGGTLAVPSTYLLARRLFGVRVAFFAAALVAARHAQIHISRTEAVIKIQGSWLVPLELYFLVSALQERSLWRATFGAILLGMHFMVYVGAQLIAGYALVYLGVLALASRPFIRRAARAIGIFWFSLLLLALPGLAYGWRHPDEFLSRLNTYGTFHSGWLEMAAADTGKGTAQLLLERVVHAFLSLNHYPAFDFYGASAPLLSPVTAALFLIGLLVSTLRTRDHRYLLLNGWFWSVTLAVGLLTSPPSADSYRMLMAIPPALILAALGLDQVLAVLGLTTPRHLALRGAVSGGLLVSIAVIGLSTYYADFARKCRYGGDFQTRFASYLGNYLRERRILPIYLLSDDTVRYGTHASVDFLSGGILVMNHEDPVETIFPVSRMAVIAGPARADELEEWAVRQPGGDFQEVFDCENLMMAIYEAP